MIPTRLPTTWVLDTLTAYQYHYTATLVSVSSSILPRFLTVTGKLDTGDQMTFSYMVSRPDLQVPIRISDADP